MSENLKLPLCRVRSSALKDGAVELALADNRGQGSRPEFPVHGHRNGDGAIIGFLLHHAVTAFLPHRRKAVLPEEDTHGFPGKLPTPRHARLQIG